MLKVRRCASMYPSAVGVNREHNHVLTLRCLNLFFLVVRDAQGFSGPACLAPKTRTTCRYRFRYRYTRNLSLYNHRLAEPCSRFAFPSRVPRVASVFSLPTGTLSKVNLAAREEDAKIAAALRAGGRDDETTAYGSTAEAMALPLHGLVAISCDVCGVNRY